MVFRNQFERQAKKNCGCSLKRPFFSDQIFATNCCFHSGIWLVTGISLQKRPRVIDCYIWKAVCAAMADFSWDWPAVNCTSKNSAMDNCRYQHSYIHINYKDSEGNLGIALASCVTESHLLRYDQMINYTSHL